MQPFVDFFLIGYLYTDSTLALDAVGKNTDKRCTLRQIAVHGEANT